MKWREEMQICQNCKNFKEKSAMNGICQKEPPAFIAGRSVSWQQPTVIHEDCCSHFEEFATIKAPPKKKAVVKKS